MSVNYCIGNIGVKRNKFLACGENSVCADNDDVLGFFSLSGNLYCLPGKLPFGDLTVKSYICYRRSLLNEKCKPLTLNEIRFLLNAVVCKFGLNRKVKSLTRIEFRLLSLAAKWQPDSKVVFLNFDGLDYCYARKREMRKAIERLSKKYEVFAAVSDTRFIPKKARILTYSADGVVKVDKPKKQKSVPVSSRALKKFLKTRPYFGSLLKDAQKTVLITTR